jgi:hypothetical protein
MKTTLFLLIGLLFSGCVSYRGFDSNLVLDDTATIIVCPEKGEVLIGCRIQKDQDCEAISEFSRRTQGWSGCSEGINKPHFVIITDVPQKKCDEKIREAGAEAFRQFNVQNAVKKLKSGKVTEENYLDGTPVLVSIRYIDNGQVKQIPFQKCFREKVTINGSEIIKPFTPHFVYHGSGVLNKDVNYGCLVCQQDCSGGLICNNQGPCCKPVPLMQPDWNVLPAAGTLVTLVIKVIPRQ